MWFELIELMKVPELRVFWSFFFVKVFPKYAFCACICFVRSVQAGEATLLQVLRKGQDAQTHAALLITTRHERVRPVLHVGIPISILVLHCIIIVLIET